MTFGGSLKQAGWMQITRTLAVVVLVALAASPQTFAVMPTGTFGLGIIAGEPTGFSGAYTLSNKSSIDGALAYSYERQDSWEIHSDYLVTGNRIFHDQPAAMDTYFGIGVRFKFEEQTRFGIRIPVGVAYQFQEHPIQVFGEIAPILNVTPGTDLDVDAAVGGRYFF